MVLQGSKEEETEPMETSPKKPLHNFTFPFLKWGAKGDRHSSRSNHSTRNPPTASQPQPIICDYPKKEEEGIDVLREKPALDLKAATQTTKDAIFRDFEKQEQQTKPPLTVTSVRIDGAVNVSSTSTTTNTDINIINNNNNDNNTERPKLSVQLSRKEIEDDYMVLVGHGPPEKPEERPKAVQKHLDVSCILLYATLLCFL